MGRFIFGLIMGYVITRVALNPYVQRNKMFIEKEKYLLHKLKQRGGEAIMNVGDFLREKYPDLSDRQIMDKAKQIAKTNGSNFQTPGT